MKLPTYFSLVATASLALIGHPNQFFSHGFSASNPPSKSKHLSNNKASSFTKAQTQNEKLSIQHPSLDAFIFRNFGATECDDNNSPPTLKTILQNIQQLTHQGSDIRGVFVDHARLGRISQAARAIERNNEQSGIPALTPFSAYCLGHAFAKMVLAEKQQQQQPTQQQQHQHQQLQQLLLGEQQPQLQQEQETTTIALGRDPRPHGTALCDSFARGAQSADESIRVVYTGIATTPSMFHFCRAGFCDGAVMVTASHLPSDRNGFKFCTAANGGFTKSKVQQMNPLAQDFAQKCHDMEGGYLPPSSGIDGVYCSEWVDYMPNYATSLKDAICSEIQPENHQLDDDNKELLPLKGLKIVLNSGNGSGGFFNKVLQDLGADVSASIHVETNGDFPAGIPNPEKKEMIAETIQICEQVGADLGILLDTDADRSGFVVPVPDNSSNNKYIALRKFEPLNRNRLIALLSVIFSRSSPGCSIVTDSVTSEGLATFLEEDLGLKHVRYLKGYANVIGKAKELNDQRVANAEMAIETSGHCAMKENGFVDDGTYTAVKVIGLLAREKLARQGSSPDLLGLISNMKEMSEEAEIRMEIKDGSLETTAAIFDLASNQIEDTCNDSSVPWALDTENLEGIRVRTGMGGFFMMRKSLHDPLISVQVESASKEDARETVIRPLLKRLQSIDQISNFLDMKALEAY